MLFPPLRRLLFLCACVATASTGATNAAAEYIPLPKTVPALQTPLGQTLSDYIKLVRTDTKAETSFKHLQQFLDDNAERSGWFPKFSRIRENAEIAFSRTQPSPGEALEYLQRHPPVTGVGLELLGEALIGIGKQDEGAAHIRNAWRRHPYLKSRQKDFLKSYAHLLTADDHAERLDMLLWDERWGFAQAMLSTVSPQERALANARISLMARRGGVDDAIRAVPDELRDDPGLAYERVRWRRRKGRENQAIEFLLRQPPAQTHADKWWRERHLLARYALRHGHYLEAYELARDHALTSGIGFADGEFLAGWLALRFLNDPQSAYRHFKTLQEGVTTPVSIARAAYWRGRAAEKMADASPRIYWQQAAKLPTTYYGQIAGGAVATPAAEPVAEPDPPKYAFFPQSRTAFKHPAEALTGKARVANTNADADADANTNADADADASTNTDDREFEDIVLLAHHIGQKKLGNEMLLHRARQAESLDEFDTLANIAARLNQKHIQLRIAKTAARKHLFLQNHLYPVDGFPHDALRQQDRLVEPALLLAIARQESEFDPFAVSPSGALGMMQLLPNTARHTAARASIPYNRNNLTRDPSYNVRIGETYIGEMVERFDGSYILAIASYNAGPTRVSRWIKNSSCDPRKPECDPIDWIEQIPIEETRNYVQRVVENLQNYRRILNYNRQPSIHADLGYRVTSPE
ncbi:MAG: lytic transglycosylase domain-containing protein [Hyphomicrobiales bacterium]|nr:lytic transglycosylase domain-containing protein [Hyphomicrobiales bacterium]